MMDWEFYLKRKKISLESFLAGITTQHDAKIRFKSIGLDVPDQVLKEHFSDKVVKEEKPKTSAPAKSQKTPAKKPRTRSASSRKAPATTSRKSTRSTKTRKSTGTRSKKSPETLEEDLEKVLEVQKKEEKKDEKRQYFRKVIKQS